MIKLHSTLTYKKQKKKKAKVDKLTTQKQNATPSVLSLFRSTRSLQFQPRRSHYDPAVSSDAPPQHPVVTSSVTNEAPQSPLTEPQAEQPLTERNQRQRTKPRYLKDFIV